MCNITKQPKIIRVMLKYSIRSGIWIFTILLLVVPVIETEKYNSINSTGSSTCYYHQDCELLKKSNYFLLNLTQVLQDFISVLLNGTCVYDSLISNNRFETSNLGHTIHDIKKIQKLFLHKLKYIAIYSEQLILNPLKNTINYYVNSTLTFKNILLRSIKENNKYRKKYQIKYRWKRRTLCGISNNEKYSTEGLFEDDQIFSEANRKGMNKKTLLDYDAPFPLYNTDDVESMKEHVRVKRSKSETDSNSPLRYQQDYLKELANSFPRNSYELTDEKFDGDDVSFGMDQEIKSQEYLTNDKRNPSLQEDQLKILNEAKFLENYLISTSPDTKISEANTLENKNVTSINETGKQETVNRQVYHDFEIKNLPEEPMLVVELVRKKRNNFNKRIHNKRKLRKKASPDIQNIIHEKDESFNEEKFQKNLTPSSLVAANIKADLLRIRRKTKNDHHKKKSQLKKKKKHVGKKHNHINLVESVKDVSLRKTDRSRVRRKRKSNKTKREGNLKVTIANVVAKRSNDNFHGKSVKSKESIEKSDSENDSMKNVVITNPREKLKQINGKRIDAENSKRSLVRNLVTANSGDLKVANLDESTIAFLMEKEKQGAFIGDKEAISPKHAKLRTKRNKNTESNHGFLNKEEELRYYQNIREPGSEINEYNDEDESLLSVGNEIEGSRAVRSIEEVKELAKKLVMKVNELQNYLNIEEAAENGKEEKRSKTQGIDELCSNVSNNCDAFKEAPNDIVKKCVPVNHHDFESTGKIVERKVDPMLDKHKLVKVAHKNSVEKKRSVGSRRIVKMSPSSSRTVRKDSETKFEHKWGKWTDWSSCSVTCGKGRQIRWRYCLHDCSTAETEMEEKACQLPACPPGKFLGIF